MNVFFFKLLTLKSLHICYSMNAFYAFKTLMFTVLSGAEARDIQSLSIIFSDVDKFYDLNIKKKIIRSKKEAHLSRDMLI